jgi:hypothetical protein
MNTVAGLFLWEIRVDSGDTVSGLWVTTRTNSVSQAGKKAEQFLEKNKKEYPKATISSIYSRGTIDA